MDPPDIKIETANQAETMKNIRTEGNQPMSTMNITERIRSKLFSLRDEGYARFQSGLMPSVSPDTVIGVRTPILRAMAVRLKKEADSGTQERQEDTEKQEDTERQKDTEKQDKIANQETLAAFLTDLPHRYFEENQLHAFLISLEKEFERCVGEVEAFLPWIDNWATCDQLSPRVFRKEAPRLLSYIERWIASEHVYTIRFGVGMLMAHFLDDRFEPGYVEKVAGIRSDEYYVNMMIAWYFATALAKQYDSVLPFLEQNRLEVWTHDKAIQKAVESDRITPEQKGYLRTLKRKKG